NTGGAINIGVYGGLNITRSTITNNASLGAAAAGDGGAINITFGGTLTITDSLISGNSAKRRGGGINSYLPLRSSTNAPLPGNSASTGWSAYFNTYFQGGDGIIRNSTISGNSAAGNGGGIRVFNLASPGRLLVQNTTITNNTAGNGGGISKS